MVDKDNAKEFRNSLFQISSQLNTQYDGKKKWNAILQNLTKKYGNEGEEPPQIFGDYRDHLCVPPPQEEPKYSFSLDEIVRYTGSGAKYYSGKPTRSSLRKAKVLKKKKRKPFAPIHNLTHSIQRLKNTQYKPAVESESEHESDPVLSITTPHSEVLDDKPTDDESDIEFLCEKTITKEPEFYYFPKSKRKCLRHFVQPY